MRFSEAIAQWSELRPFFVFECFPPRTDQGFENLLSRVGRLAQLGPLAITVTWGAGGSTRNRSLDLAGLCQSEHNLNAILHLTCTNMEKGTVEATLRSAKERGIKNILALRGDPPRGSEYWIPADPGFVHAIDLVRYIKTHNDYASHFCVGVAGYPDGHDHSLTLDEEVKHLKAKIDAGAEFIVTQVFYDIDQYIHWKKKIEDAGISVPIIPAVAPIQSHASFIRMTKLCKAKVPDSMRDAIEHIKTDDQKVKDFGIQLAKTICQRLTLDCGARGIHFCTFNLEKSVRRVLEELGWSQKTESPFHSEDSHLPPELLITASEASHLIQRPTTPTHSIDGFQLDPLKDDFPNGRFGDYTSPAYGALDPWDGGGIGVTPAEGIALWGSPSTVQDVQNLFLSYLESKIPCTPFSLEALSKETTIILPYLLRLTANDCWTIASQPAVDAARSDDLVFGWGPGEGYVFQKSFVEFFCTSTSLQSLTARVVRHGNGAITYYASNSSGGFISNAEAGTRHAVTWGVFPGQEIAQPTVIEQESFLSWKDEAFSVWSQWAQFYPPNSPSRATLKGIQEDRWLVSMLHHDFKQPDALWAFLLGN
ncbi:MTHFR-domain-containing protein [Cantharellus anzutake]|uniref:MTHFR-domain-containing protein n=1 Tax=Cantharellus anzutake TaxID=1750568 RepID=UPI001907E288|nr:MTHFR-domain-containing protein [Cantharellus anzutake]KAF8343930.1 MTHFR-domain-containing protein [Cantharellus anzutake]